MGRDYDPVKGQWFEDLEENEIFLVLSVDPDTELVEIQYENGDIEEIDLDTWHELDLERTTEPEGWASADGEEEEEYGHTRSPGGLAGDDAEQQEQRRTEEEMVDRRQLVSPRREWSGR